MSDTSAGQTWHAPNEGQIADNQERAKEDAKLDSAGQVSKHFPRSDDDLKPPEQIEEPKLNAQSKSKDEPHHVAMDDEDDTAPSVGFFASDTFQRILVTINISVAIYSAVMAAMLSVFVPQHCCPEVI